MPLMGTFPIAIHIRLLPLRGQGCRARLGLLDALRLVSMSEGAHEDGGGLLRPFSIPGYGGYLLSIPAMTAAWRGLLSERENELWNRDNPCIKKEKHDEDITRIASRNFGIDLRHG